MLSCQLKMNESLFVRSTIPVSLYLFKATLRSHERFERVTVLKMLVVSSPAMCTHSNSLPQLKMGQFLIKFIQQAERSKVGILLIYRTAPIIILMLKNKTKITIIEVACHCLVFIKYLCKQWVGKTTRNLSIIQLEVHFLNYILNMKLFIRSVKTGVCSTHCVPYKLHSPFRGIV